VGSAAIGLDVSHTSEVLEMIVAINKSTPFPGALSFRFVKGSTALLGFTKFPINCVLEMDGVDSGVTRDFFKKAWDTLESNDIPYTLHWGKINFNLDADRVRKMYGEETVNKWIACRHQLLDEESRKVFTNDFMKRCGLDA
jgi:hypothetical protein